MMVYDFNFCLEYCRCFNIVFSEYKESFSLKLLVTHSIFVDCTLVNENETFINNIIITLFAYSRI